MIVTMTEAQELSNHIWSNRNPTTMFEIELPIELTNGNDGRGTKWFNSAKLRKEMEQTIRLMIIKREPYEYPVNIRITRVLGKNQRLWDADSILRGNAKELIDSIVSVGWLHDDGPKWVVEVTADQDATQRDNGPKTIVRFSAAR